MGHALRTEGHQVPRRIVEQLMRELDPEGCEIRRAKRLRRRTYRVPGPNFCWHTDGYDKLKPFGFPIHGCIDGWSRKIIWLRVARSNNKLFPAFQRDSSYLLLTGCTGTWLPSKTAQRLRT